MGKYWQFFRMGFGQLLEYRMDFLWSTLGVFISTVILYLFWVSILGSSTSTLLGDFSLGNYYLLISVIGTIVFFNFRPIADDVWEGDLAVDLLRPYNYFLKMFIFELPYKIIRLILGLAIILGIGYFTKFRISAVNVVILFMALSLAMSVRFFIACLIGGLAFWFKRVHGFDALIFNVGKLFSGELIPLQLLPPVANLISLYLPFRYMAYFPVQIALGQQSTNELILGFITLALWLVFVMLLNNLVWKRGLSQFEATGR